MKDMLKTINKFSKLAVLFTALAYAVSFFMESDIYEVSFMNSWASNIRFLHLSIVALSLVVCAVASVVFGIIATLKTYRKGGVERWLVIALTLWNLSSLAYVLMVWGSYPYRI